MAVPSFWALTVTPACVVSPEPGDRLGQEASAPHLFLLLADGRRRLLLGEVGAAVLESSQRLSTSPYLLRSFSWENLSNELLNTLWKSCLELRPAIKGKKPSRKIVGKFRRWTGRTGAGTPWMKGCSELYQQDVPCSKVWSGGWPRCESQHLPAVCP
jgi:hypothetical protein